MKKKPVMYLAGDSTMQSYREEKRPQAGWGEALCRYLGPGETIQSWHRTDSPFEQERCYENGNIIVDNCAMAGRSSKTFLEEGRLRDIEQHMAQGDYLLIQFGHNDASDTKKERYVPLKRFEASLSNYIQAAENHGAIPVLCSSIALCPCADNEEGEKGKINRNLPDYADVMEELAARSHIFYLDMGKMTRGYCQSAGAGEVSELYLEDKVHLTCKGADIYAKLAAEKLREFFAVKTEENSEEDGA